MTTPNRAIKHGTLALDGTAQQLTSTATDSETIAIKARAANAGKVYIGSSTVTSNTATTGGLELSPGEGTAIDVQDPQFIFVKGTNGDFVSWITTGH